MASDYRDYIDFTNSEEYIALYDYYNQETFMDVLGVSRQENPHSCFLRWLFDPVSSHGLGDYPLRKLIEAACCEFVNGNTIPIKNDKSKNVFNSANDKIRNALEFGNNTIDNVTVKREQVIANQRRADIVVEFEILNSRGNIKNDSTPIKVCIVIENKVYSPEQVDQTEDYANYFLNEYECDYVVFLYLKPKVATQNKCKSDEFLDFTYQGLLDKVLEPCRQKKKSVVAEYLLNDYIRCLSKAVNGTNDTIMAVSKTERAYAKRLWENHSDTLKKIFDSIYKSDENSGNYDLEFYCAIAYALSFLENDLGEYKEKIEEVKKHLQTQVERKAFEYKGITYESGKRGKASIAFLARLLLIEYVNLDKNKNLSIDDIRNDIRRDAKISCTWHNEILFKDSDVIKLESCSLYNDDDCPFSSKNRSKLKRNELSVDEKKRLYDNMEECLLYKQQNNRDYNTFSQEFIGQGKLKYVTCCKEAFDNVFYNYIIDEESGKRVFKDAGKTTLNDELKYKVTSAKGDYYVAKFWGAGDVENFAKLVGHTCKPDGNGKVVITS